MVPRYERRRRGDMDTAWMELNRRKLLRMTAGGLMGSLFLPLVPIRLASAAVRTGRRLILIELSGANDGLNTIIPTADGRYQELRPTIGIETQRRAELSSEFALNAAMKDMMTGWSKGEMAVVHGLGYPGANRSHFKSIAIWETGGDGSQSGRQGWLTEDIEGLHGAEALDAHGISLGGGMGVFTSPGGMWMTMTSARQFQNIEPLGIKAVSTQNEALSLLMDRARTLDGAMQSIAGKMSRSRGSRYNIRGGKLAEQMNHIASLIDAGVKAPVFKTLIGGFDTHENQSWRHRNLLEDLSRSISGLRKALIRMGEWDNTLIMTYSEFGRRAYENESDGTDHGTAAPHFLCGGSVAGGLYGDHPDLHNLVDGDMEFTMDYRSLYQAVLGDWFEITPNRFSNFADKRLTGMLHA